MPFGMRPCRECGKPIELKIRRDVERKFYCSVVCRATGTGRLKDMQPLWDKVNLPEVNARKGRPGDQHHNYRPIGSTGMSAHGYVKVKIADGDWRYEHRLVAGEPDGMHVHHDDEDQTNNVIGNLISLTPSEHKKLHHRRKRDAQ
jgi:hypothetical protein